MCAVYDNKFFIYKHYPFFLSKLPLINKGLYFFNPPSVYTISKLLSSVFWSDFKLIIVERLIDIRHYFILVFHGLFLSLDFPRKFANRLSVSFKRRITDRF